MFIGKISLKTALVGQDNVSFQIVKELLNHQGVIFSEICTEQILNTEESTYPCVILTDNDSKSVETANKLCFSREYILNVINKIPLDDIKLSLMGMNEEPYLTDTLLEPFVTDNEIKLVGMIRECFHKQELPYVRKWFWPDFKKACCIITHDIDMLNNQPSIENSNPLDWITYFYYRFILKKAYEPNIEEILIEERKKKIKSSFYCFSDYKRYQKEFMDFLDQIKKEGHEIGLHGSLYSHQSPELLNNEKKELEALNARVTGERQHTLNFLIPHTWRYQEEAGFEYDLSLYYNDKPGFRGGICHPYHPFDVLSNKKFHLFEIPTSFMDWTVIDQRKSLEESKSFLHMLLTHTEKYNGCIIFNFHNTYVNKKRYTALEKLFDYVLDRISNDKNIYWIASAEDCINWWKLRESATIEIHLNNRNISCNSKTELPIFIELPDGKILTISSNTFIKF